MGYPTDVTDAQWALLAPMLTMPKATGRPPTVDRRAVLNALLYMDRTGCQWRLIPHDFPNKSIVRYYFDLWTGDGTLTRANDTLREALRVQMGREPEPAIAVMDSQSVKTTEAGGERGFDGGKNHHWAQAHYLGRYQWFPLTRARASGGYYG